MTKEALKLALEALELHGEQYPHMVKGYCLDAITAIKEALANEALEKKAENARELGLNYEPEPVAWMCADESLINKGYARFSHVCMGDWKIPVYTTKPQRTWVGLTDEERVQVINANTSTGLWIMATAIEAKIRSKND
jgi:hypothetical protein